MKIICTSDWHLGNLFHGNDRLPEHRHFLSWLLARIKEQHPDALLIAGDIFDNGNPSAAAQSAYYEFLADATETCPDMNVVIIAGNHDSASRLEAPRALLTRHKVEIRGNIHRSWVANEDGGNWVINYDDLMIPINGGDGSQAIVLTVPYLRSDVVQNANYSEGVNTILRELTAKAREKYRDSPLIMIAHMYAKGADIAKSDASEKIVIGGQEEVNMQGWDEHPDYFACGHIHKRQHIWNTDWAHYSGSVLPMSFAEKDYHHGVDMVTIENGTKPQIEFLEYEPQHKLMFLPEAEEELTSKKLEKRINAELKELEALIGTKNAVLCKIQKIIPELDITTISGSQHLQSIDDILNRDPLDTLKETFVVKNGKEMTDHQEKMLTDLLNSLTAENDNAQ